MHLNAITSKRIQIGFLFFMVWSVLYSLNALFSKDILNYQLSYPRYESALSKVCWNDWIPCVQPLSTAGSRSAGINLLVPGQQLVPEKILTSSNGLYRTQLDANGNFIVSDFNNQLIWNSSTAGRGLSILEFEKNGNLVLINATGQRVWSTNTVNSGADRLVLLDSGDVVLYAKQNIVWSSNPLIDSSLFFQDIRPLKEPAYHLLERIAAPSVPFGLFLMLIIFSCLLLKLVALQSVSQNLHWMHVLPYLLVLSFLHEGTQLRIAIALSIALWAIIFFARQQVIPAIGLLLLAATFHLSVVAYFAIFSLMLAYQRWGRKAFILASILTGLLVAFFANPELVVKVFATVAPRYTWYFDPILLKSQNSSGLFQYFIFFVALLTAYVLYFFRPQGDIWVNLKLFAVVSGAMAMSCLVIFSNNVVLAARLSELLLLPILLVLGETLYRQYKARSFLLCAGMLCTLLGYGAIRAYITFR